jgi:hypothetical protein
MNRGIVTFSGAFEKVKGGENHVFFTDVVVQAGRPLRGGQTRALLGRALAAHYAGWLLTGGAKLQLATAVSATPGSS